MSGQNQKNAPVCTSGSYEYAVLPNGTAEIRKYLDRQTTVLDVPGELGGHPVTRIGEWAFFGLDALAEVLLPEGLTHLGKHAFCQSGIMAIHRRGGDRLSVCLCGLLPGRLGWSHF